MEEKIWNCIVKRLSGVETIESKELLDFWLAENELNQEKYNQSKSIWELSAHITPEEPEVPFSSFSIALTPLTVHKPEKTTSFWKYGIAASITAIVLMGGLFAYKKNQTKNQPIDWIVKRAEAGKMLKIILPDSSTVWLNSASEISYASTLTDQPSRLVNLSGEAYFQVKHDQKHPFVVKSGALTTTVYGTSFSVRAYVNEANTSVAVNSGKVGVLGADQMHKDALIMLLPNDQLTYNIKNKKTIKSTIANGDVDAWTNGVLVFEQTPIAEVIQTLSRKYKVKIDDSKIAGANCRLTARFNNQPLTAILKAIRLSLQIQSTQVEQTIYLKGGNCM